MRLLSNAANEELVSGGSLAQDNHQELVGKGGPDSRADRGSGVADLWAIGLRTRCGRYY